jgi:hypothetical protein
LFLFQEKVTPNIDVTDPFRMHPLSSAAYQASMGYPGMDAGGQQQSPPEAGSPNTHHDPTNGGGDQNGPPSNYTDINQILDQILNITDQSLDEAQVKIK